MNEFLITRRLEDAATAQGVSLAGAQPLAGDGSDRRFFRLPGSPTKVLLWHPYAPGREVNENDSYFRIGRHLRSKGVPVPEIFHYCPEEGWMLVEDLGDISLEAVLKTQRADSQIRFRYRQALDILVQMQIDGLAGFDTAWCFDTSVVDGPFLRERECLYFVLAFLQGYLGLKMAAIELAEDFDRIIQGAVSTHGLYFLHRDFQSRNLMIKDGRLRVIDFQGARLGPLGYDVAALLIDPYVGLSPEWQEEFLDYYLQELQKRVAVEEGAFRRQYRYLALSRNLQILGAFGFLTKVKKKTYFARYIPAAVKELQRRLEERAGEFPRLEEVVLSLPKNF
ncbi:MAG: phosphotransferase [Deltaproteobacteria bacterium]|nr:phosphotransferase [Deltaproteobacteria bacterium]MBI4795744.1 phosphotransferase [Deltaproteobacteria bacterium]